MKHAAVTCLAALILGCAAGETCPSDMWDCGGLCYDLQNDSSNCGACGIACDEGLICVSGLCVLTCPEGMTECSGVCRDLQTDSNNCGTCAVACPTGFICADGACTPDCPEGYTECTDVCRDLMHDPSNCGACGTVCAAGESCLSGTCTFACPAPYTDCSGTCADLSTDHLNCGACGAACAAGEICTAGSCTTSCLEGLTLCSGACADLMRDPANCGACGSPCSSGEVCYDGTCTASCPGGFTDCSGSCRDLDSDRLNCGACDAPCDVGEICVSGACAVRCVSPLVDCSGVCSDTRYDPANCGACGTRCGSAEACVAGSCVGTASRNVLVYYQSFSTPPEPAGSAATLLGWTVTTTSSGPTFASSYDAGGWNVIVVDAPGTGLPADVRTRVLSAISAGLRVIFSWYDPDTDAALATALGVSTSTISSPLPLYPTSGASVNFFTSGQVFPAPLTSSDDAGDNGDLLTLTSGGEIVISASSATGSGIAAITNSGTTIVLGFLPWDFKSTDNDADGTPDMTEMFMNLLQY